MSNGLGMGVNGAGVGFDGMNGAFPNMGMNGMGDFNQMMQFMPNGMPNNMMGMVPTMMGTRTPKDPDSMHLLINHSKVCQAWVWTPWPCLRVCMAALATWE